MAGRAKSRTEHRWNMKTWEGCEQPEMGKGGSDTEKVWRKGE